MDRVEWSFPVNGAAELNHSLEGVLGLVMSWISYRSAPAAEGALATAIRGGRRMEGC